MRDKAKQAQFRYLNSLNHILSVR